MALADITPLVIYPGSLAHRLFHLDNDWVAVQHAIVQHCVIHGCQPDPDLERACRICGRREPAV
jgi:hypothetical protein